MSLGVNTTSSEENGHCAPVQSRYYCRPFL